MPFAPLHWIALPTPKFIHTIDLETWRHVVRKNVLAPNGEIKVGDFFLLLGFLVAAPSDDTQNPSQGVATSLGGIYQEEEDALL